MEQPRYRIEHHTPGRAFVLGTSDRWDAQFSDLAPYAIKPLGGHGTKELVLTDHEREEVVARRDLWPEE